MQKAKQNGQRVFIIVIVVAFLLSSLGFTGLVIWEMTRSKKDDPTAQLQKQLQEQMNQQNKEGKLEGTKLQDFTPIAKVDSLQKLDTLTGNGAVVQPGDTVTAHYTGAVASTGIIFQSSHDSGQPIPFGLNQVIKGWTEGVPGMKVGGKRRILIPADQAYGATPPQGSGIPANADLVFDIEIVKIGQ